MGGRKRHNKPWASALLPATCSSKVQITLPHNGNAVEPVKLGAQNAEPGTWGSSGLLYSFFIVSLMTESDVYLLPGRALEFFNILSDYPETVCFEIVFL